MLKADTNIYPIKKEGKLSASRRYNLLPLLPSDPDGVQRELAAQSLPSKHQNYEFFGKI